MKRLRAEIRTQATEVLETIPERHLPPPVPEPGTPAARSEVPSLALSTLTRPAHRAFVEGAYRQLLGRDADESAIHSMLRALALGESKIMLLGRLRYSDEGRAHATHVRGLRAAYAYRRLCAVPMAGYLVQVIGDVLAAPLLARQRRAREAWLGAHIASIERHRRDASPHTRDRAPADTDDASASGGDASP